MLVFDWIIKMGNSSSVLQSLAYHGNWFSFVLVLTGEQILIYLLISTTHEICSIYFLSPLHSCY